MDNLGDWTWNICAERCLYWWTVAFSKIVPLIFQAGLEITWPVKKIYFCVNNWFIWVDLPVKVWVRWPLKASPVSQSCVSFVENNAFGISVWKDLKSLKSFLVEQGFCHYDLMNMTTLSPFKQFRNDLPLLIMCLVKLHVQYFKCAHTAGLDEFALSQTHNIV